MTHLPLSGPKAKVKFLNGAGCSDLLFRCIRFLRSEILHLRFRMTRGSGSVVGAIHEWPVSILNACIRFLRSEIPRLTLGMTRGGKAFLTVGAIHEWLASSHIVAVRPCITVRQSRTASLAAQPQNFPCVGAFFLL